LIISEKSERVVAMADRTAAEAKSMKWLYFFGEGDTKDKATLGGKGANLGEMTRIGLPVPPGFTITTEACVYYFKNNRKNPEGLKEQVEEALARVEKDMGREFCALGRAQVHAGHDGNCS
jgi:pyruvate,orthophosphate dikinase